ncbi:MAG: NAD(P)/FAD-dependent oxidoreductase [Lachnospiraceae bacterium]|nr:NAD(P)/FAD-dependent oxidoreductase [Candidatus Colinaster equi]
MKKCIVIGCGAAGMMAAIAAAKAGADVTVYEKNEKAGKKIYITGKGRCNVTNSCTDTDFFDNVVVNSKFLYSAFYSFDNNSVVDLIESNGCPLKTERGGRVFPMSDHSSDVIKALTESMKKLNVKVNYNCKIEDVICENGRVSGVKISNGKVMKCDSIIVATGGMSYSSTGSTGDGHEWLRKLGHTLNDCLPALVPLTPAEEWYKQLQGLALKNVKVSLYDEELYCKNGNNKKSLIYEGFGEMLFTHFGISGPLILSASSFYAKKHYGKECILKIDLKPALSFEQLDKRLLRDFEENQNKAFKNVLGGLVPSSMIPVVAMLCGIDEKKAVNSITKEERNALIDTLKGMVMHITGTRDFNEAIITRGGVSVKEVNPSTMESKLIKGLYIAGELLDVDALTGGFNLQIAWSTGHLAGENAAIDE